MKYPWLRVGVEVTPRNPNPRWAEILTDAQDFAAPRFGSVYTVCRVVEQDGHLVMQLAEMPEDTGFFPGDFLPMTRGAAEQVEAMRALVRDAMAAKVKA